MNDDADGEVTRDVVFSTLSNHRRRLTIRYLRAVDEPVAVRDLARRVAAWENEIDEDELSYKQRKRVYTSLHQTHLPKLDDAGFATYDRNRGQVILEDRAAELYPYLDPPSPSPDWTRRYLAVGVGVLAAAIAAWAGVPVLADVPGLAYAALSGLVVVVVASVEAYARRDREPHALLADDDVAEGSGASGSGSGE